MAISEALLAEFDQEMASARRSLERIPEDKLGWKPHEKSMTLGRLAGHVVVNDDLSRAVEEVAGILDGHRP